MTRLSRRQFLLISAGAGAALPGKSIAEYLIPYVIPPTTTVPGVWALFATTCRECPAGCGMHMRHRDGRSLKAEGNPESPINRGGLCARGQSALQGQYDPDRLKAPLHRSAKIEQEQTWNDAIDAVAREMQAARGRVAIISDLQTGSLSELMHGFANSFGTQPPLFFEPFSYDAIKETSALAGYGPIVPRYRIESCDFLLSLAVDFLDGWISPIEFASRFAELHAARPDDRGRFVYAGPRLSMTAANADEFILIPPGIERWVAVRIAAELAARPAAPAAIAPLRTRLQELAASAPQMESLPQPVVRRLADELAGSKGLVLGAPTGARGPGALADSAAALLLNIAAGRLHDVIDFTRPHALSALTPEDTLEAFINSLTSSDVVLIHQANLVYARPSWAARLRNAGTLVYLGSLMDETAAICDWVLPVHSPLESWADYEPYKGVHALVQPTMAPLYDTRHAGDVLLQLGLAAGHPIASGISPGSDVDFAGFVLGHWMRLHQGLSPGQSFDDFWDAVRRSGGWWPQNVLDVSAPAAPLPATANVNRLLDAIVAHPATAIAASRPATSTTSPQPDEADLWAWPSALLFDGRVANRGWLQENPDPITTIAWGSWIDINPKQAASLRIEEGDVVTLENESGKLSAPVRVTEELLPGTLAIAFGQGHTALGKVAEGLGANAFAIIPGLPGDSLFGRVRISRTGSRSPLIYLSATRSQEKRDIVRWTTPAELRERYGWSGSGAVNSLPPLIMPLPEGFSPLHDMYSAHGHKQHRWAMTIDLQRCIGCQACAIACQAENNIATVGARQITKGREMAWLKVVPYLHPDEPRRLAWLPLHCQHCDAAPCEPVCPVFASVHNDEGLNAQVYNRCIGTRYCSNNCPYKVRRFNWLNYKWRHPLELQLNQDATVRQRGVMEKCTFCIQRIRDVEYRARFEGRPVRDGEVQPACAQSCPTRVFVFGDLLDPNSQVSRITRGDVRRYHVLEDLNTKPAVTFLQRLIRPAGGGNARA